MCPVWMSSHGVWDPVKGAFRSTSLYLLMTFPGQLGFVQGAQSTGHPYIIQAVHNVRVRVTYQIRGHVGNKQESFPKRVLSRMARKRLMVQFHHWAYE